MKKKLIMKYPSLIIKNAPKIVNIAQENIANTSNLL
jgi:hypothetical protein